MAQPIDAFLNFIEVNSSKFENSNVDILALQKKMLTFTPITLKYSDPDTIFNKMPAIILINLCKYCTNGKYQMSILNAVKRVVAKDSTDDDDTKIQLVLLVHLTKLKIEVDRLPEFYNAVSEMKSDVEMTDMLTTWKEFAMKVINHSQVNKTINNLIKEYFGSSYTQRIAETSKIPVSVRFFNSYPSELRGFSGVNNVHISEPHFQIRMIEHSRHLTDAQRADAVLIDIATVTLHEYSHVRIRQVLDDLNMSTPSCMIATADASDPEFGRVTERRFFRIPIDWLKTIRNKAVPLTYINEFIAAIRKDAPLPVLLYSPDLIERKAETVMHGGGGADFYLQNPIEFC